MTKIHMTYYRKANKPYFNENNGLIEGMPEPEIRDEKITAKVFNEEGEDFDITVEYYIVDNRHVTVTGYDKLLGISDERYDISECIKQHERRDVESITFAP